MELLIRIRDKNHPTDANLNRQLTKRGDVIAIQPDGWNWGVRELTNPDWRIISVPNLTRRQEEQLLEGDSYSLDDFPRKRKRQFDLDSPSLGSTVKDHLEDDSRRNRVVSEPILSTLIRDKV
jgi:hypothetical protein